MLQGRNSELTRRVSDKAANAVRKALDELGASPQFFGSVSKGLADATSIPIDELCALLQYGMDSGDPRDSSFSALLVLALKWNRDDNVPDECVARADDIISQCLTVGNGGVKQRLCIFLRQTFIPPKSAQELVRLSIQQKSAEELALNAACTVAIAEGEMMAVANILMGYFRDKKRTKFRGLVALGLIRLRVGEMEAAGEVTAAFDGLDLSDQLEILNSMRDLKRNIDHFQPFIERLLKRQDADGRLHYLCAHLLPAVDGNVERIANTLLSLLSGDRFSRELLSGSIAAFSEINRSDLLKPICLSRIADNSVDMRRTAARGLFVAAALSVQELEVVANRVPQETDMASLEFLTNALVRSGEGAIPHLLRLIEEEAEKTRLDLYVQCLAKIGKSGIEALSRYLDGTRSDRLVNVILGCIQQCGYGALEVVPSLCRFIDSADNEEHMVNALICILAVSENPTTALNTFLRLAAFDDEYAPAVGHWAMLGIRIMKDDAIRLIDRFLESNADDSLRNRFIIVRTQLDGGLDPKLSYLSEIPVALIQHFVIVAGVLKDNPNWSLQKICNHLITQKIAHPKRLSKWKPGTVRKHMGDFEKRLGRGRLTARSERKAAGLTDSGKDILSQGAKYLDWLRGSRHTQ